MSSASAIPRVLSIAGSDPSGGAGVQADLKTFTVCGVYGMAAITAVTVQNTLGVRRVVALEPSDVHDQVEAVLEDVGADAVKTGMLANAGIVHAVAGVLRSRPVPFLVVDPVLAAGAGGVLLDEEGLDAVRSALLPLATLVTPNRMEAERLSGVPVRTAADARKAAGRILAAGPRAVLVKGGHVEGPRVVDVLAAEDGLCEFEGPRLPAAHGHGTGCVLSAAIAARMAAGVDLESAVSEARRIVVEALAAALPLGRGTGPVNVLAALRRREVPD